CCESHSPEIARASPLRPGHSRHGCRTRDGNEALTPLCDSPPDPHGANGACLMLYRTLLGTVVPMCLGWAVYSGAIPLTMFIGGSSTHDVPASPDAVDAAIADLTLEEFTGSLTDTGSFDAPGRWVRASQIEGGRSWTLMEGKKEVLVMTAHEAPYDK